MAAEHKQFHILTETLGVVSGITLLLIAQNGPKYKHILQVIGATTLLVDLYFINTWLKENGYA